MRDKRTHTQDVIYGLPATPVPHEKKNVRLIFFASFCSHNKKVLKLLLKINNHIKQNKITNIWK